MRHVGLISLALVCVLAASLCVGQQLSKKMSNQDVMDMVSLGLSDDVVIDKIHGASGTDFDTSIDGLKALKAGKVSDAVIRAMINPHPAPASSAAPVVAPASSPAGVPDEVGVYILLKGVLTEMEPEVVGWQTGGVMKSIATQGLTKGIPMAR
jgi:hypothetical protein